MSQWIKAEGDILGLETIISQRAEHKEEELAIMELHLHLLQDALLDTVLEVEDFLNQLDNRSAASTRHEVLPTTATTTSPDVLGSIRQKDWICANSADWLKRKLNQQRLFVILVTQKVV